MTRGAATLLALLATALAAFAGPRAGAEWRLVEERHFAHALAGKPCGRALERIEEDGDRIRTTSRIELRFRRLGEETRVDQRSEFIETKSGDPVEATVYRGDEVAVRYRFRRGDVASWRVDVERGGAVGLSMDAADDFLTPREVAAFVAARHAAGAAEIRYRTLEVEAGLVPVEVELAREGPARFGFAGRAIDVVRYASRTSLLDAPGRELLDASGRTVESTVELAGLGALVARLATPEDAGRALASAGFDLLAGTFVRSAPIERWRTRARLSLVVSLARRPEDADVGADVGADLPDLPSEGAQSFVRIDRGRARIEVDVGRGSMAAPADRDDARWLQATELIDHAHPEVRALAEKADDRAAGSEGRAAGSEGRAAGDAFATAEALRELVARHLRDKNLATALGSASEAARARAGDCTEHAVLLAALLRARGIPSRLASGLVYVPDLGGRGPGWGWHLWTQALVAPPGAPTEAPAWFDFDATLSGGARGYHAAHVLVATTDLAGGATDAAFARAVGLLGSIAIEVAEEDAR